MGVPSFYRWLATKYPKIVVNAVEKAEEDGSLANPNGREFDNLYLDMNGIIHPCFHPEYDDILLHQLNNPVTYEEVFNNIFEYIDRIMNIVRPRKLLYMAIDGVAPRAKMNQQRARRYRTAKDRETLGKEEDRLRRQYESEGRDVLPKEESEVSDSNVITPGTWFMYELSKQLQTYISLRISNNSAWRRLKVILSDANAPGEGEHKIMSFIRLQRTCPGYNPNTSHVLYGLDADLIMLALATHEIHFSILRENVLMEGNKAISNSSVSFLTGKSEINVVKSRGWSNLFDLNQCLRDTAEQMSNLEISTVGSRKSLVKKPYQFLHVWILREYLKLDLKMTNLPEKFETDLERTIDDFIFICFFAGNDFLPHMPTLEIHEDAIDLLIHVYKEEFKNLGGYLVDMPRVGDKKGGYMKLKRVEKFILAVGAFEEKIFKKRSEIRERKLRRILLDIEDARGNGEEDLSTEIRNIDNQMGSVVGSNDNSLCNKSPDDNLQVIANTKMLKEQLKSYTLEISDVFRNGLVTDMVKLGAPGWKKRYYKYKFSADTEEDMANMRKNLVEKYIEGLCWVLLYYFSGVPSWTWFFPYHYGPFASDMKGLSSTKVVFQRGLPFKPFDQLMAVLPPMSSHALPLSYQSLMTNGSNILDFYPSKFDIDTDGKRFLWQGICKLPFIEEDRLLAVTKEIEKDLTEDEAKRNAENVDRLFIHCSENFALQIASIFRDESSIKQRDSIKIDTNLSGDINGFVHPKMGSENVQDSNGLTKDHDVLCLNYYPPSFCLHIPCVLEGATIPETVVSEPDIEERQLWHDDQGYHNRSYNQSQGVKRGPSYGLRGSCPGVIKDADDQVYHNTSSRSYNQSQGVKRGPSYGLRGSCPGVRIKDADDQGYPNGSSRSYNQIQGVKRGPSYGLRGSCPGVIIKDAGRGWSPRGRGKMNDFSLSSQSAACHDATLTQTRGPSWHGAYGRGPRGNENGRHWSGRAGSPINSGLQWSRKVCTQSTNHPGMNNSGNGHFWTGSGSHSNQWRNGWADTQSRGSPGEANSGGWRRVN